MLGNAIPNLPRQVQPLAVVLEHVDDAEALFVVVEAAGHELVDDAFAGVAERRMSKIVTERDRFRELFVEAEDFGDRPRDLRHLERVCQPRSIVIAGWSEKDLGLVAEAAERLAVDDAVAVALKRGTDVVLTLGPQTPARICASGGLRRQNFALASLKLLADCRHTALLRHDLRQEARAV